MYAMKNRKLQKTLKTALLASVALVASGCTADWSNGEKTEPKPFLTTPKATHEIGLKEPQSKVVSNEERGKKESTPKNSEGYIQ